MKIKERLEEIKSNLQDLQTKVESGDAEAIKSAGELSDEYERLEAQAKDAEKYTKLLKRIGNPAGLNDDGKGGEAEPRTLGEKAAAAVKAAGISAEHHGSVTAQLVKAATDPNTNPSGDYAGAIEEVRYEILRGVRRPLTIAGLFASENTNAASVTYFTEGAAEGGPAAIAENGKYQQLHVGEPVKHTDALKKIGTFWKDTDELLSDAPRLAQNINERADYLMDITEEDQLFAGNGSGENLLGLVNRSGLQVVYYDPTSTLDLLLKIKSAKKLVRMFTPGFRADGLLISEDDWDTLTSLRDKNNQFLAGGPFVGQYGNGQTAEEHPLWGLRPVPSQATPSGLITVGAWRLGGSVIRKGTRAVEVTNANEDDFLYGRVTLRVTERIALAVRYASAFVKLCAATFSAASGNAVAGTTYYARTGEAGAYVYNPVAVTTGASVSGYYTAAAI